MTLSSMSCETDTRTSDPENSKNEKISKYSEASAAKVGDSAAVMDTGDEEPRKDKQQWRTIPK